jgi:enediyne biosynthesis protein E4
MASAYLFFGWTSDFTGGRSESSLKRMGWFFMLVVTFFVTSCQNATEEVLFIALSEKESGIDFRNDLIENDRFNIIQYLYFYNGSGVGIGDFNKDGLPDVVLGSNFGQTKLYLNTTSAGSISFWDITDQSGFGKMDGWTTGISVADVNADGWPDIYICQVNYKHISGKNRLLIHQGLVDGVPFFKDQAHEYGLDFQGLSTQAAFFDYDRDGDLDMYLLNHSTHQTEHYAESGVRQISYMGGDKLYKNEGGVFVDVTQVSGILSSSIGYGLGVAISDLNRDGWPDIYIANDFHENDYVFINNRDGTFSEKGTELLGHTSQFSMGVDIADINADGWPDIFTLDMMPPNEEIRRQSVPPDSYEIYDFKRGFGYHHQWPKNALQLNRQGMFSQISTLSGVDETDWSWACLMADFTNNGYRDLFITNGILRRPNDLDYLNYISSELIQANASDLELAAKMPDGRVANYFFSNTGQLLFVDRSHQIKGNNPGYSNGAAYADLDGDGDLDIIINNLNAPASVLVNQSVAGQFISFLLHGDSLNPFALGATILVFSGEKILIAENNPVKGFMSSTLSPVHIGLGDYQIDSIHIIWPEGQIQRIAEWSYNSLNEIHKSTVEIYVAKEKEESYVSNFPAIHTENVFSDASVQKLIPWLHSSMGPALAVGDINGDGKTAIFLGGAEGELAGLYINHKETNIQLWFNEKSYEDVCAAFFDADNDGDLDLFVGSGGNKAREGSPVYLDRLYENKGGGLFERREVAIPPILENTSVVLPFDINSDGKMDLVVGYLGVPHQYGQSSGLRILINQGNFRFLDETENYLESRLSGMITDMVSLDFDGDGDLDLLICGEWMHLTILENRGGYFYVKKIEGTLGIWRSLLVHDLDGDGDSDIVAGNMGLNNFLAKHFPGGVWIGDFDLDGTMEPILYYTKEGKRFPVASRDLLIKQMSGFKKKHPKYADFSKKTMEQLFQKPPHALELEMLQTIWLENEKGSFRIKQLPLEVQFSPVFSSYYEPSNKTLYLGQNFFEISPYLGRQDAGAFLSLKWNMEQKEFIMDQTLSFSKQLRQIQKINDNELVLGFNNDSLGIFFMR